MESNEDPNNASQIKKDPAKYRQYALIIASICALIMLFGILFLGYEFKQIDKEGVVCLNDPMVWAESQLNKGADVFDCSCRIDSESFPWINYSSLE